MLDLKFVRENPEIVKQNIRNKFQDRKLPLVDEVIELDEQARATQTEADELRANRNKLSKQIGALMAQGKKEEAEEVKAKVNADAERLKELEAKESELNARVKEIMMTIPNIIDPSVPIGKDDSENVELRKWGEPSKFDFEPLAHWDIGKNLGILDPETAAKVTGARFHFYKGLGARLERAVISYFLNTHTENGYTEVLPPYMVNRASMTGTGQLPKFEEDAFRVANNDYFLIPTAEVPVTNMHRDEILSGDKLPIKYCAYSACFRAEAGSAGRDQRGLIRQHQFNKVELVKFVDPATSYDELEKLTNDAERVLQGLGLPYRVVALSTGDIGFSSAKTYDIEVWMPSYNRYVEISSCSNFEDYQARRAAIRFKNSPKDKAQFVHTLNGSGVAVGRTVAAILENYQNADGSVTISEALVPFMGTDIIK